MKLKYTYNIVLFMTPFHEDRSSGVHGNLCPANQYSSGQLLNRTSESLDDPCIQYAMSTYVIAHVVHES